MSCTFATIFGILFRGVSIALGASKIQFLDKLFPYINDEGATVYELHNTLVSHMYSGVERFPANIAQFYEKEKKFEDLRERIENEILPMLDIPETTFSEIRKAVETDTFLVSEKKEQLLAYFGDHATFLTEVLRYAMLSPLKRLPQNEALDFHHIILGHKPPDPCTEFCGREEELNEVHNALSARNRVVLTGVAGLGKSEIMAAYASEHAKDYAIIIWLQCKDSLRKSIEMLHVKGSPYCSSPEEALQYREQLLRALPENALLLLDGVDWPLHSDTMLQDVMSAYRCSIAITTRCPVDDYPFVEVGPIAHDEERFCLITKHYQAADTHRKTISRIMAALENHTMAIILAAKILQCSLLTPAQLLTNIYAHNLLQGVKDTILLKKVKNSQKKRYCEHIKLLFGLSKLNEVEKQVLCGLTVMPTEGINEQTFGTLMLMTSLNDVHRLIDLGYVSNRGERVVTLYPLIRETVETEIGVTFTQIASLYDSLKHILLMQWHWKLPAPSLVETIIDNLSELTCPDCRRANRSMYHDAYTYFDRYGLFHAQSGILARLRREVAQNPLVSDRDRALVMMYDASILRDAMPQKAVELLEVANSLISIITGDTATLKGNILGSLGMLYHCLGDTESAKQKYEAAIALHNDFELGLGEDYVALVVNYCVFLASDRCVKDSLSTLLELHKEVRAIDAESPLLTTIERILGGILLAIEDTVEASKWLHSAYQRQCMQGGEDSPLAQEIHQAIEHYKLF